jgi:signal transduction histidine kinase
VVVSVKKSADGEVSFEVRDEGPGIPEHARAQLFDAFFTTRTQGTGIGLAVVKRIADDHGFAIEIDSGEGHGAVFRVRLPKSATVADENNPKSE